MTKDTLETIGKIHDRDEHRDAIHIAVLPVEAGERLKPGEHVDVARGIATGTTAGNGVGIVDPFLTDHVQKGERFWLLVYPRTIQSLRHVWTHPSFPDEPALPLPRMMSKERAETWLRVWCDTADAPPYEDLIATALRNDDPERLCFGTDCSGEIPDEVWDRIEIVTGTSGLVRATYFSCAC